MRARDVLNRSLDRLTRPVMRQGARSWSSFHVCGCTGFVLGVALGVTLTYRLGLSVAVLAIVVVTAVATFLALAMATKIIISEERLIYYHHEVAILALVALVLWWLDRKRRDPAFMLKFDEWLLRNKLAGALVAKLDTARLARTLGTLLRNGVPLLAALGIARNVLDNRVLANDVDAAAEEVKNGIGLSAALGKGKRFPRLALQMIQVGEESGALDAMLVRTAETFEQETSLALDRMLAALVPVVTIVLAAVVGVVVLAVLMPLYGLTNAIG